MTGQDEKSRALKKKAVDKSDNEISVEHILAQWRAERPDIDPTPMAICGLIWRKGDIIRQAVLENVSKYGLDFARFDVLLTLRRQGKGKALSPSILSKEMMLSTSAMTNRLDRLEKKGLIERLTDPNDRRGLKIMLTEAGFALADEIVVSHLETESRMLDGLTEDEKVTLRALLEKL